MLTLLVDLVAEMVRTFHGRVEAILVEQVDIGLGSGAFVLGIVDQLDSVELSRSHDCGCVSGWFGTEGCLDRDRNRMMSCSQEQEGLIRQ